MDNLMRWLLVVFLWSISFIGIGFGVVIEVEPDYVCTTDEWNNPITVDLNEVSPEEYTQWECEEICDGISNDADEEVDEWFDADSDGIADCVDSCPDDYNETEDGAPTDLGEECMVYAESEFCDPLFNTGVVLCDWSCSAEPPECELDPITIEVQKYECWSDINFYNEWWFPDSEWELGVNPSEYGCEPAAGYNFGYISYEINGDEKQDFLYAPWEMAPLSLCTSDSNGVCSGNVPFGMTFFGELSNSLGEWPWDRDAVIHCSSQFSMSPSIGLQSTRENTMYYPQSILGNPTTLKALPGDTVHCAVFNPKPIQVHFTKYECPDPNDRAQYDPDRPNGDIEPDYLAAFTPDWFDASVLTDLGCEPAGWHDFGYALDQYQVVSDAGQVRSFITENEVNFLCNSSWIDGTCSGEILATSFLLWEIDDNDFVDDEDMISLFCYGEDGEYANLNSYIEEEPIGKYGNPQWWMPEAGDTLDCYAINPKVFGWWGGKSGTVPDNRPEPPSELLETGPEDDWWEEELPEPDDSTETELPDACVDDNYIIDRHEWLMEQDIFTVLYMPQNYKDLLWAALEEGIKNYIEAMLFGLSDDEKNQRIKELVCDIELKKEALGKKYQHIGRWSWGSLIEYVLQYTQDLLILEYVM